MKGDVDVVKHTIELRMPKIFGKKKTKEELEGETEVIVKNADVARALSIGAPLVIGLTVGYLVGFNRGVNKNSTVYIIK